MNLQTWETITIAVEKAARGLAYRLSKSSPLEYNDLYQAGMLGALRCLKCHNPELGNLKTHLHYRINGQIQDLLTNTSHAKRSWRRKVRDGDPESTDKKYLDSVRAINTETWSLDKVIDGKDQLYNIIPSDSPDPADNFISQERSDWLWTAIELLPPKHKAFIALHLQGCSLRRIGQFFGQSETAIGRMRNRIFSHLAGHPLRSLSSL